MNADERDRLVSLFSDEDYRFQIGVRPGTPEEFFAPTKEAMVRLAARHHWLAEWPERTHGLLPEGELLLLELLDLIEGWRCLSAVDLAAVRAMTSAADVCRELARRWEPDFLLLRPDRSGLFKLVGGAVCFPSSWAWEEKLGRTMPTIHVPVPGLNDSLGESVNTFLARLRPGAAWLRANWGLSASPELNQHPLRGLPRLKPPVDPAAVWMRVERQALVALPRSGGVLFGLHVDVYPLAEWRVDQRLAQGLNRALRTMPEEVARYKGLAEVRHTLADWLVP